MGMRLLCSIGDPVAYMTYAHNVTIQLLRTSWIEKVAFLYPMDSVYKTHLQSPIY